MNFNLGDFVRFVDERREGYITRIINEQMIAVTDDDGFEIPVLASKVTRVHGHSSSPEAKHEAGEQKPPSVAEFKTTGIYLAVADARHKGSVVHFHLVNESSYQLLATVISEKQGKFKGEFAGIIDPQLAVKVYSASLNELDLWPEFQIQLLLYSKQPNFIPAGPILLKRKFRAKDFSGNKKMVPLINQQAWLIELDKPGLIIDPQKLKESFFKPASEKLAVEKPASEIDLHIEKLRDDHQFLNSAEILDLQLQHFQKALDAAIVHKLPSIIFIHGTGNGVLRHEIHKTVSKHPQVKTFMDARREKFGYGATEVFFK